MKKWLIVISVLICVILGLVYLSLSTTDKVFQTCEILNVEDVDSIDFTRYDSVLVAASTLYESNFIKDIMQGEQYRKAWATPIKVPIVFLDTLMGGMKIIKEGGGKQTHSLRLEAKNGLIYTMRSITKDPEALIPEFARTLGLENIIVDGISAQHPYAAVVVAQLAEKAGILHTEPKIVFVPQQSFLGEYSVKYGNRLFLLEHETEGGTNWTAFEDVAGIMDSEDLQELRMKIGSKVSIDKRALVKARLFDILIGDWDRHAKQWGWVVQINGESYKAIPLPGDRDNAFFNIEGLIPNLIANKNILPGLQDFEKEIDYLPGLVMPFDVYFLKNISDEIFVNEALELQKMLDNKTIDEAFKVWPEPIYRLNAVGIIGIIKGRRNNLIDYAKQFSGILKDRELLKEPIKGSKDTEPGEIPLGCFECD